MNGKKKYVAIALVLLVGIGSFVFASPDEEEKGSKPEDSTVEQSGTKDPEKDNTTDEIVDDNEVTNPVINTNPRPTVVDNSYANALAAVLELEKVLTSEQADVATELVDRVTNQNQKDSLATRVENALNAISATELVEELEDMVANATEKSNLVSALSFRDDSAMPAVEKIAGTELEEVKEELAKRIEDLKEILEDNEAPTIEAETIEKVVVNEGHYNKDVTVKVSEDAKIIIVTKDDSDYETKEKYTENGTYKVLAVDEAFNEAELTFTIDKIKPLIKGVEDGAYYNTSVTPIIEEENIQNVVVMKDGNKYTKYKVGNTLTEEGTYKMRMTDKAGNKFDYITFVIDTTAATVDEITYSPEGLTNGTVKVTITLSEEIKEVTGWTLTDDKKGIYREFDVNVTDFVTVYDLAGNETKADYAVTNIDKVLPTISVDYRNGRTWILGNDNVTTNLRFVIEKDGNLIDDFYGVDRGVGKSFTIEWHAATYGEGEYTATVYDEAGNSATTTAMVDVTAPTLTITIEEGKTKVTGSDNITENLRYVIMKGNTLVDDFYGNDRGVGNSFNIEGYASTYGDGEYTVTVYDEVGNSHTTTAMVDTHAPEYATLRMLGGKSIKENGVQTWYVRANQDINIYMTFKEKLAVNAKVKVNGEELPTTYVKEVDGTYMYMATYKVTESSKQGAVSIEVYGYADKVGNVGKTLTNEDITTPGQKNVSIDTIAPEYATLRMLGGKSIKENGVQTWYVRANQDINIYMTFKEKLAVNAKVKVNGEELPTTYVKEVDGTYMYMATYKVTESSKQGAVSIEVYGYADKVGNVGKTLTNEDITTPGQKNVSIDTIAPEIVFEQDTYYVEKNGTFDHVKLTAKVIDNIDGESTLTPYKMDFVSIRNIDSLNKENVDEFDSSKEGTFKVYYKTFDKVGNEATKILNVVVQDTRTFELLSKSANTQDNYKTMIGVIVTNKEIKEAPAGWSFSLTNPTVITKKYTNNTDANGEDVEIYDLYGNKLVVNMVITDINELVYAPSVVLDEDTTLEETVTVEANQEKVIDLNGKTLTVDNSNTGSNARLFQNKGKLTFKNGSIIQPVDTALGVIDNIGGEVILDNVEILDKGSRNASSVRNLGGKVTILNSNIVAEGKAGYITSGSKKSYIYGNAAVYNTGDLVIKNSTIEGNNDGQYAVYIEKGTALIENVTIDHLRGGISIYGGNVTLNNVNVIMPTTGRSSYYAIYAAVNTTYPSDAIITINGGSYAGTRSSIYASNSTTDKKLTMNINSGTFIGYGYKSNPYIQFAEGSTPEGNYNINIKGGTFKDVTLNEKYIVDGYKQVGDNVVPE